MKHDDFEEDFYDSKGNLNPGGLYDSKGNIIAERVADYMDYISDDMEKIVSNKEQK